MCCLYHGFCRALLVESTPENSDETSWMCEHSIILSRLLSSSSQTSGQCRASLRVEMIEIDVEVHLGLDARAITMYDTLFSRKKRNHRGPTPGRRVTFVKSLSSPERLTCLCGMYRDTPVVSRIISSSYQLFIKQPYFVGSVSPWLYASSDASIFAVRAHFTESQNPVAVAN